MTKRNIQHTSGESSNSEPEVESLEINSRSPAVLDGKQSMRMFPEVAEVAVRSREVKCLTSVLENALKFDQ